MSDWKNGMLFLYRSEFHTCLALPIKCYTAFIIIIKTIKWRIKKIQTIVKYKNMVVSL